MLNVLADRFEARAEELVDLLALENGKVKEHARYEVATVPEALRFNAALTLTDYGRAMQVDQGGLDIVVKQPAGVAGIIAPWNSPAALTIRSLAPANKHISIIGNSVFVAPVDVRRAAYQQLTNLALDGAITVDLEAVKLDAIDQTWQRLQQGAPRKLVVKP